MKPWYWPVTTTVYKLGLAAILGAGVYTMVEFIWPFSDDTQAAISAVLAVFLYWSIAKRDWL